MALIKVVSMNIYCMLRVDRSYKLLLQPRERFYSIIPREAENANGPEPHFSPLACFTAH